jgi:metallo-beta-lactamase class B
MRNYIYVVHAAFLFAILTQTEVYAQRGDTVIIQDKLIVVKLSDNALMHVSEMQTQTFGKVFANGMLYLGTDEALLMDTPPDENLSRALLNWFRNTYPNHQMIGVVVNHFHADCLGGLNVFHEAGIVSYSHERTPVLIDQKKEPFEKPKITFADKKTILVSGKEVECFFPGEAHTNDNIVTYLVEERILFGGCPLKALGASKGNLADANINTWSESISKVRDRYKDVKIVVPGHGNPGGPALLDYTIQLFKVDR